MTGSARESTFGSAKDGESALVPPAKAGSAIGLEMLTRGLRRRAHTNAVPLCGTWAGALHHRSGSLRGTTRGALPDRSGSLRGS